MTQRNSIFPGILFWGLFPFTDGINSKIRPILIVSHFKSTNTCFGIQITSETDMPFSVLLKNDDFITRDPLIFCAEKNYIRCNKWHTFKASELENPALFRFCGILKKQIYQEIIDVITITEQQVPSFGGIVVRSNQHYFKVLEFEDDYLVMEISQNKTTDKCIDLASNDFIESYKNCWINVLSIESVEKKSVSSKLPDGRTRVLIKPEKRVDAVTKITAMLSFFKSIPDPVKK